MLVCRANALMQISPKKELWDGNSHHTHNAQYLIQGSSLLKGAYDPQENTEYGRHHQGSQGQLYGCRQVVLHQGQHRHAALKAVAKVPPHKSCQPFKVAQKKRII